MCFVSPLGRRRRSESLRRRGARRERWTRVVLRPSAAPAEVISARVRVPRGALPTLQHRSHPNRCPGRSDLSSSTRPPSALQSFESVLAFVDGLSQPALHTYTGYEWLSALDGRPARCSVTATYSENLERSFGSILLPGGEHPVLVTSSVIVLVRCRPEVCCSTIRANARMRLDAGSAS
uniref:Uncharacterized protein n=1 Tax=Rhodococcus sp. NS1 TaxID=402236 RepID=A0A097SQD3_9NOCA|nr:hypothetical protein LRS1606.302 [Rhodococcus sp. NS1]